MTPKRFAAPAPLLNNRRFLRPALDEDGSLLTGQHVYLRKSQWQALNELAAKTKTTPFNVIGRLIDIAAQATVKAEPA